MVKPEEDKEEEDKPRNWYPAALLGAGLAGGALTVGHYLKKKNSPLRPQISPDSSVFAPSAFKLQRAMSGEGNTLHPLLHSLGVPDLYLDMFLRDYNQRKDRVNSVWEGVDKISPLSQASNFGLGGAAVGSLKGAWDLGVQSFLINRFGEKDTLVSEWDDFLNMPRSKIVNVKFPDRPNVKAWHEFVNRTPKAVRWALPFKTLVNPDYWNNVDGAFNKAYKKSLLTGGLRGGIGGAALGLATLAYLRGIKGSERDDLTEWFADKPWVSSVSPVMFRRG